MKKILIALFAASLCACTSSPEKKAQKLITEYLKENLKDPSSYEAMEFSKLDSSFTTFSDQAKVFSARFDSEKAEYEAAMMIDNLQAAKEALQKMEKTQAEWEEAEDAFKPKFNGWKMSHKYRAKNGFGALDIGNEVFKINPEVTMIEYASQAD